MAVRHIHVISPIGGTGNRLDLELVCPLLEQHGFDVVKNPVLRRNGSSRLGQIRRHLLSFRGRFDANLFLGPIFPEWMPFARQNLWMPNPEGFHEEHRKFLPWITLVLAKTRLTETIFRGLGRPTEFVSFTSRDRLDEKVPREQTGFLHAASSPFKGTARLLETWQKHPEWPELTVIHRAVGNLAPNIRAIPDHLPEEEYQRLQNAHTFHMCCSEAEGFGHYLMEPLSCGAVTLTTDGPPMNELVQDDRGVLVKRLEETTPEGLSHRYYFDPQSLEDAVEKVRKMDDVSIQKMGAAGRAFFLENDRFFRRRFIEVIRSL